MKCFIPVLLVFSITSCKRLPNIITASKTIGGTGDLVWAEGSWRKTAGTRWPSPVPNTFKITCNLGQMTCSENGAWVETTTGTPWLRLLPETEYGIVSWKDKILTAQHEYSNGDATLIISLRDSKATRTWRGTRARGTNVDADAWIEENLQ